MKRKHYIPLMFLTSGVFLLMAGCVPRVAIRSDYDFTGIRRVGVLNFVNYLSFENSGSAVADEFVRQLVMEGYDVVERGRIDELLREEKLSPAEISGEEAQKLGKRLGIDVLISGTVTRYLPEVNDYIYFQDENGDIKYQTFLKEAGVGVSVRMIDVKTGLVVWADSYDYQSFSIRNAIQQTVSAMLNPLFTRMRGK